jgi:hypothetical protein
MAKDCVFCEEPAEMAWQPFGPDENPLTFVRLGSHYRGFTVIPVCGFCQREKIEMGDMMYFRHRAVNYTFQKGDSAPVAIQLTPTEQAMYSQLLVALDLFAHEFCHNDGTIIGAPDKMTIGAHWVEDARAAILKAQRKNAQTVQIV